MLFLSRKWLQKQPPTTPTTSGSRLAAVQALVGATSAGKKRINTVVDEKNVLESALDVEIEAAHERACSAGEDMYLDPKSGLSVFSRVAHLGRGRCCGSMCRHCPYGHVNVPASRKADVLQRSSATTTSAGTTPKPYKSQVYTKTGDKGTSSLFTGERRAKHDPVFDALGTVDELSSHMGVARAHLDLLLATAPAADSGLGVQAAATRAKVAAALLEIQRHLLDVGSVVATPDATRPVPYDPQRWTADVERLINELEAPLPPLASFILPGGGLVAAQLHVCRSVCRRAERCVTEVLAAGEAEGQASAYPAAARDCAKFINRLSDFFFVAARALSNEEIRR